MPKDEAKSYHDLCAGVSVSRETRLKNIKPSGNLTNYYSVVHVIWLHCNGAFGFRRLQGRHIIER